MTKVNLNEEVKVMLTREGEQVLARKHRTTREIILKNGGEDIGEFILRLDKNYFYVTQVWILLNDFKDYFGWDSPMVFKGNELYFDRDERKFR